MQQQEQLLQVIENNHKKQQQAYQTLQSDLTQLGEAESRSLVVVQADSMPYAVDGKFVIGEVEQVYIDTLQVSFASRIDTGAVSSSLDARNIVLFERDGHDWVRFDVYTDSESEQLKTFEQKVKRFVSIKTEAGAENDRRPVIRIDLQIGQYKAQADVNLVDRSHLEYPLLLGRKFMRDIAIVDVGKKYIHGKNSPVAIKKTEVKL